jgi:opacity protein-like surface antigen
MDPYFSLFAKLGITSSSLEDSPQNGASGGIYTYTNTGLSLGLGGQFNVNEAVGIRLGFDSYQVGDAAINATSKASLLYVGGLFKF